METASGAGSASRMFEKTKLVADYLSTVFQHFMPTIHEKFRKAFAAGVWERTDPGPWIGRTIVYKLQVEPHVDPAEAGPTASFPCGSYDGGVMNLPTLGARVR